MERPAHSFGILSSQFIQVNPLYLSQEAARLPFRRIFRSYFMRDDGINGAAAVKLSGNYRVILCPVVDGYYPGHYSLGYIGAAEDTTPLVVYFYHVPVFYASPSRIRRIYPDGVVQVSIRAFDLTGLDFPEPRYIIMVGMYSPPGVIGNDEQGIFLGSWQQQAFLVGLTIGYPLGIRRSLLVIGEVLG